MKLYLPVLRWLGVLALVFCMDAGLAQTAPVVASPPVVNNIGTTNARLNGNVTGTGGAALTGRGFVLSPTLINSDPVIGAPLVETISVAPFNTGAYLSNRTGLTPATSYTFKAYASNAVGTTYSSAVTFILLSAEPASHATGFSVTARTPTSLSYSWTAATGNPDGYIVLRRTAPGSGFTAVPADGVTYSPGDVIGDATVVSVGSGTTSTASGLDAASQYTAKVFPYNGTGVFTNYRTAATIPTVTVYTLSQEPASHAASFTTGTRTNSGIVLEFSAASTITNAAGYIIIGRQSATPPTGLPVDGTGYTVGATIGDGTVAAIVTSTAATSVTLSGLTANLPYSYTLIPYNVVSATTYNYRTVATIPSVSTRTLVAAPTVSATGMVFSGVTSSATTVSFSYGGTASGFLVLRSTSPASSFTSAPTSGFSYNVGDVIGTATVIGTGSSLSTVTTGLSAASIYTYKVFPYNGSGSDLNYRTASPLTGSRYTLALEPAAHSAAFSVSAEAQTTITLSFSAANTITNAAGYLILRRAGAAAPTGTPVNATNYVVGSVIGDGVVAARITDLTATSATITGLTANSTHSFSIIPFNFSAASTQTYHYRTAATIPTTTGQTLQAEPTTSSALSFANISSTGYRVDWTAATGATQYILLRSTATGTTLPNTDLGDNVAYSPGDVIGNATVAYVGSLRTFTISGMSPATAYGWKVYPFNGTTPRFNYRQTSPGSAFRYTIVATEPGAYPATFTADFQPATGNIDLEFSAANTISNGRGYVILRRANAAVASVPTDGTVYTGGTAIGTSFVAAVITDPTQTTVSLANLTDNTRWHFQIFPYNSDAASEQTNNYRTVATAPVADDSTAPVAPASQAINLTFTNITTTGMTLNWQAPVSPTPIPTGYLVLRTTASGTTYPNTAPTNGTTYTAGSTLGNATVVYSGSAFTTAVTGLALNSLYSYAIYGFRNNGTARRYNTVDPTQGQRTTLTTEPAGTARFTSLTSDTTEITLGFGFTIAPPPDGYLLLRTTAAGSTIPNTNPVDGTGYVAGNTLGNATVVYSGTSVSAVSAALQPATRYQYRLYLYNGTGATGNTNYTAGTDGFYYTLARSPQRQPDELIATGESNTSIFLSFPAASTLTNSAGYLVMMKEGLSPLLGDPVNATIYTEGSAIGNGTVVAVTDAAATSVLIENLQAGTYYNFALYPFNRDAGGNRPTFHYRTQPVIATDTAFTLEYDALPNFRTVLAGSWQSPNTWNRQALDINGDSVWIAIPNGFSVSDSSFNVTLRHAVQLQEDVRVRNLVLDSALTTIDDYNVSIYGQLTRRIGQMDANFNSYVEFIVPEDSVYSQSIPASSFENDELNELIINNPSGVIMEQDADLRVLNVLALLQGSLDINGNRLTLSGDLAVFSGQIAADSGTVRFSRSTSLTLPIATFVDNLVDTVEVAMPAGQTLTLGGSVWVQHHMSVTGGNVASQNSLRFLATEDHTAYLSRVATGSNITGNVAVEQYIPGGRRAYRFAGHPFSTSIALSQLIDDIDITGTGGAANGFTPTNTNNPSAFIYNPLIANPALATDPGWTAFTSTNGSGANAWPAFQGIRLFFRGSKGQGLNGNTYTPNPVTIDMSGQINVGNTQFALPVGTNSGFTIVSNPYPSPINLRLIGRGDSVRPNYHVYNPYAGTAGAYISVPATVDYVLPAYAGFFASATQAVSGRNVLSFTEDCKSGERPEVLLRSSQQNVRNVVASIAVNGYNRQWDLLWLMKQEGATDSVDFADGRKFTNDQVNAFTISREGRSLSIDTRSFGKMGDDTVKLGFTSSFVGNFSFGVDSLVLNPGTSLLLIDNFLGTTTQLLPGSSYPFSTTSSAASSGNNRFVLVFRTAMTLPTGFRNVRVRQVGGKHELSWSYQQGRGRTRFIVQHGNNGSQFAAIGESEAAEAASDFSFIHATTVATPSYYRIEAVNADGSRAFSNVVKLSGETGGKLMLSFTPNPASPGARITLQSNQAVELTGARLMDTEGKVVAGFGKMSIASGIQELPGLQGLRSGQYIFHYFTNQGQGSIRLNVQ